MRGSASSAAASHSCISARVIASSEAKGSSRASTGLPESRVRRKATRWRIPPESSAGRASSKPAEAEAREALRRPAPRLGAPQAAVAQRQRRVVERREPGKSRSRCGMKAQAASRAPALGAADRDRARARARAARRSAPAGSTCRIPTGRPGRAPRARGPRGRARRSSAARRRSARLRAGRRLRPARGRRFRPGGELLGFRRHLGILAHSALLTKKVRKVDKRPARASQNGPGNRNLRLRHRSTGRHDRHGRRHPDDAAC